MNENKLPFVYIVILNWLKNGLIDTIECLESVFKLDYPNFEVIVVDNESQDESVNIIGKSYPRVILIRNEENLGYCAGNNIGMRYALKNGADYLWLLNNDTVVYSDSVSKMVDLAESSFDIGLVSPTIYYFENPQKIQYAGSYIKLEDLSIIYPDLSSEVIHPDFQTGKSVYVWGTGLFIKRNCIEKIGFLNEAYFAYYEDADYTLRSMHSGFRSVICSSAKILHKKIPLIPAPIISTRGTHYIYFMIRNRWFLGSTYLKGLASFNYKRKLVADLLLDLGNYYHQGENESMEACLHGLWDGFRSITGSMTESNKMPSWVRDIFFTLASWHPYFISYLIRGDFGKIIREIIGRVKRV